MCKKIIFICIFLLFCKISVFANIRIFWSTVNPTVEGVNTRVIPKSSVKDEFFRSWDEYAFVIYTDKNAYERAYYARLTEGLVTMGSGYRQFSNWLNSNQNLVFAYSSETTRGLITICFITKNWVYEISFNIFGTGSSTRNNEYRRNFDVFIDDILRGI